MKIYQKKDFPVENVRRFLEPGPIVLVSSCYKGETTIMTMGWHMIMEFSPSLIGCYIWNENYSYELIRKSKECVINLPTFELMETAVDIGNHSGREMDKFQEFDLTKGKASKVRAPLIKECFANFECKLYDGKMARKYNFFMFEVVKAHVAVSPKYPKTFHYMGDGEFMISGGHKSLRKRFRPEYL